MGQYIEHRWFSDRDIAVTDYLQDCFEKLESGTEQAILRDPLAIRDPALTDEEVDKVIAALDAEYDHEMEYSYSYHRTRSGATLKTEFHRLGPDARRAMVEGLDYLIRTVQHDGPPNGQNTYYFPPPVPPPASPPASPAYDTYYEDYWD